MEPITILAAVAALFGGYKVWESSSQKKKEERKRLATEIEKTLKLEYANEQITKFEHWLTPVLVIDSNIWMNESYTPFFECLFWACRRKKYKIEFPGVQFDEISNIKKAFPYDHPKTRGARSAIFRIEEAQKAGLLKVIDITVDSAKGAYADKFIVKLLAQKSREGRKCTFFSDDKELRIRARQHLTDNAEADWQVIGLDKFIGDFQRVLAGRLIIKERKQLESMKKEKERAKEEARLYKEDEHLKKKEHLRQLFQISQALKHTNGKVGIGQPTSLRKLEPEDSQKP